MNFIKESYKGVGLCFIIASASWFLGNLAIFKVVGGPVFAILIGMLVALRIKDLRQFRPGIKFTSKKILQYAVILLGFGLNLQTIVKTGSSSLPIIVSTISTSLIVSFIYYKLAKSDYKTTALVGIGSSICGGSAIAAAAPCIDADDKEIAQSISVIFIFNIIAALIFPLLGRLLGFASDGYAFGIFAGTAVNDMSSVTATAASWDTYYNLKTATLDVAVMVKLTRTLAIIPITLFLIAQRVHREKKQSAKGQKVSMRKILPTFILYFIGASLITTFFNLPVGLVSFLKTLSKFFICLAMAAIGINTDIKKLLSDGKEPILQGFICWISIIVVSLIMQRVMGIW